MGVEEAFSGVALPVTLPVLPLLATDTGTGAVLPGIRAVGGETVALFSVKPTLLCEALHLEGGGGEGERGREMN